jgi:cyclopropane fatty-acyl-phospholipid synthase-like methyltransferase
MSRLPRTDAAFFDEMYRSSPDHDPWSFASSAYELDRYDTILGELAHRTFRRCLEPGCSIGVFSRMLATRCTHVLAMDHSSTAIATAGSRTALEGIGNIEFRTGRFPEDVRRQDGPFDLFCLVELGYYFTTEQLGCLVEVSVGLLDHRATIVASHWTGTSDDHVLSADAVHDVVDTVLTAGRFRRDGRRRRCDGFIIDRWEAP